MSELATSELAAISRRAPLESASQSAGRILIVDDEAEIRESLETLLQLEGYTVVVAGSGREGLAKIGERAFDVVLLDLALPDKNGMDVLSEIRLLRAQQAVIMITAYGTVENAVRAMQSGAANFIQKPWDNEKLLADVRATVARQKAEEENIQKWLARRLALRQDRHVARDERGAGVGAFAQRRHEPEVLALGGDAIERRAGEAEAEGARGGLEKGVFHASSLRPAGAGQAAQSRLKSPANQPNDSLKGIEA